MHPVNILEHYRSREIARELNIVISLFPQQNMTKPTWQEQHKERYEKQFTMFGNISGFNTRDIGIRKNVTMYYCPVTSCSYTSEVLKSVKQHLSKVHISQSDRQKFKNIKRDKRGVKKLRTRDMNE